MHIVYRYIDNKDDRIKYVGITSRPIKQRVDEHLKSDYWVSTTTSWRIEYFTVGTKSESEAWEAHLIALYRSYLWYNKAKKDWGLIPQFLNLGLDWKLYSDGNDIINIDFDKYVELEETDGLVSSLTISLDFDIPLDEVHRMVSKHVICPLAKTKNNYLLFIDTDIEKVIDYLRYN